jgi:glycosyltransferase involved in cell wall biosynthesis
MKILVIPTTDWTKHPVPNRLNFIFDILAERHEVHIANFTLKKFEGQKSRKTKCHLHDMTSIDVNDPSKYYILNSLAHLLKLRSIIKHEKIDVIISANILPAFLVYLIKGNVPVVFDYLDHFEESAATYYPGSFFKRIVEKGVRSITRYNLKNADSVITVTEEFKRYLISINVNDVNILPNGVDVGAFKPIPTEIAKKNLGLEGNVIGYVGSLEYWVDLETVITALPELDIKLLVVGPELFTDYSKMIKILAEKLGVFDKIIFTGRVEYTELYKYISAMDIGLNPLKHIKKNEITVGGKIFNYLACGKPVLSSRMIALENLLGNEIFYYDDKNNLIEMVQKLLNYEHNEERYMKIAKIFDWINIANKYEDILRSQCYKGCKT